MVRLGVGVKRVDVENTAVELEDGTLVSADLVVGADGVKSVARPEVIDASIHIPKASTGHNAFRFMIPKEDVIKDDVTSALFKQDTTMVTWSGNRKMILVYPVDFGKQLNVVCTHPEELSDKQAQDVGSEDESNYNQKASRETVLGIYQEFVPIARRLVEMADPEGLRVWKLKDMDEIPAWSKKHTVLIGDACHPVLPFSFSGASMAIEDAITLATLLPVGVSADEIPSRLTLYEELRRPRVGRIRQAGREIAGGMQDKAYIASYMGFLAGYDAVKTANEALEKSTTNGEARSSPQGTPSEHKRDEATTTEKGGSDRPSRHSCCIIL